MKNSNAFIIRILWYKAFILKKIFQSAIILIIDLEILIQAETNRRKA